MNVADVMDQLGDALAGISINVFRYPPKNLDPPAAIIAYPESANYAASYGRGMDRLAIPVVIVGGNVADESTALRMAGYLSGSGATSIKTLIDGGTYTACDDVTVTTAELDIYTIGAIDYIAAIFTVEVVGSGA